jgi:hypothetical protein
MTSVVLSPLRKQGDVNRIPSASTVVLLQGSGTSPTATLSRTLGSSTSPTATLACTQGSGTPLPDTLAHSYTPHCTSGPSPCIYKREVQGLPAEGGREGERANEQALSLSLATLVTPTTSTPLVRDNTSRVFPLCSILRQPIWAGARSNKFTGRFRDPPGPKRRQLAPGRGLLRVNEHLPIEFHMGSLQQPLQPGTVLRFGSLEFMSLDGGYDMVLLPPQRHSNNDGRQLARRRRTRRRLPPMAEEQHLGLSRHPPRCRRRRRGNRGQAGGGTSSAVGPERVDDAGTLAGDMSGVVLAPETTTNVVSPQHANPKRTNDASTLAKDLLGVSLVPEITVQSVPDATSPPSIDQEVPSVFHPVPFRFSIDPPSDPASVRFFVKAYPNLPGYHMWSSWDRLTAVSTYRPPGSEEEDDPDSGWDFSRLRDPSAMRDFMTACDYCLSGCSDDGHSLDDEGCGPSRECFHVDLGVATKATTSVCRRMKIPLGLLLALTSRGS